MECLEEIIGITNDDCPCVTDGLNDAELLAIKKSKSGLFLDDLEGGLNMRGLSMIDSCKNYAEMALAARATASKKLYADVLVALSKNYTTTKGAFIGTIGRPSYAGTLPTTQQYQFMRLAPKEQTDAVMKVTGLRLILDRAANVTVKIYSVPIGGNQGVEVFTGTGETTANNYLNFQLSGGSLELPLVVNGQPMEYFIVWDKVAATNASPKDLKIDCNCGFKSNGFGDYLKVDGGEMTDINQLSQRTKDEFTHGILLDVEIRCVPDKLICREYDRENAIAVTMAWAVMYKAGELLIESVLNSSEINRYTMMNREALYGKRAHFRKEYETRIMYLAQVIDFSSSDCFICKDSVMYMSGIMS